MRRPKHQGIIILGVPRSGTTLLRRLLNAHPSICCPGETFLVRAAAKFIESETAAYGIDYGVVGGLRAVGFTEDEVLARLRELTFGFFSDLARRENKPRWAAKTAVDSFYMDEIERIYGDHTYFIVLVRHGLDVVCSLREFADEMGGYIRELHPYVCRHPRPSEAFAHAWADVTRRLLAFTARRPENAILCRYEDLVAQPRATIDRLVEFVGEEASPDALRTAFDETDVRGLGDWKTYSRPSIDAASVDRWRRTLSGESAGALAGIVNPVLERCGYPPVEAHRRLSSDEAMRRYELAMMLNAARAGAKGS